MKRFLCGLVVLGLIFAATGQAGSGFIYWSELGSGEIRRANLDGTGQTTLVSGLAAPLGPAVDLAGGRMYWADGGADIRRANLDGTGQTTLVTGIDPGPPALALAGGHLYWNNAPFGPAGAGEIRRANLDGSGQMTIVEGLNWPRGVSLDVAGGRLYWSDNLSGDIGRANLDGSGQTILLESLPGPNNTALDIPHGKLYFTDPGGADIRRANLDGSGVETLVQNLNGPADIALDIANGYMYWTDSGSGDIMRANLDGTGQQAMLTGLNGPLGISLDLRAFAVTASASVPPGTPFDMTVTALDPSGNTDINYQGTVTFSTSDTDPDIVLPADYTYTAADAGMHTFQGSVTLFTPGDQTVTVTDKASSITSSVDVTVVPPN